MHVQTATGFVAGLDEVSVGAKGSFAGATIAVGSKQEDASGTKTDSSDFAIKYPMTDTTTVSFPDLIKTALVCFDPLAVDLIRRELICPDLC